MEIPSMFQTYGTTQFRPATVQMLCSHMWLMTSVLNPWDYLCFLPIAFERKDYVSLSPSYPYHPAHSGNLINV